MLKRSLIYDHIMLPKDVRIVVDAFLHLFPPLYFYLEGIEEVVDFVSLVS
jgi:hypothetical protein